MDVAAEQRRRERKENKRKRKAAEADPAAQDHQSGDAPVDSPANSENGIAKRKKKKKGTEEAEGESELQHNGAGSAKRENEKAKEQRLGRLGNVDKIIKSQHKQKQEKVRKQLQERHVKVSQKGSSNASSEYQQHAQLSSLPQSEIDDFLSEHHISITDPRPNGPNYRPILKFDYLPVMNEHQRAHFLTFSRPTPIQSAAWPSLFAGRDLVGVAETGSGKTLAFGVPLIHSITSLPVEEQKGLRALIVTPTRELAQQIDQQMDKLAMTVGCTVACLYGGVDKRAQSNKAKKANIVVATPGRLLDLIKDQVVSLDRIQYLVLDEADRMLDKGFEDDIRKIIGHTPSERQTVMFTATWPPSIRKLADTFMKEPVKINIGDNADGELRANTRIDQTVEVVEPHAKEKRLIDLLWQHQKGDKKGDRILVFCLYKKEAARVEMYINRNRLSCAGIHGDLSQDKRTNALADFKSGKTPILVATDVAARGLDIPNVKLVINLTFPLTVEDYVHRIGRTGRAGTSGKAITLFTEHDKAHSGALINVLKAANQTVPEELLKFGTTVKKKQHDAYGAFYKDPTDMKKATKITFD